MAADVPAGVLQLAEVLAQLDALHGREVWVRGVLSLEFEGRELRDDGGALWVELRLTGASAARLAALDGRQVVVRGVVDREDHGHMDLWPAALVVDRVIKAKRFTAAAQAP